MSKKQSDDPAQLQLWKDFVVAKDELQAAIEKCFQTFMEFQQSGGKPWGTGEYEQVKEVLPHLEVHADVLRKRIHKAVRIAAYNPEGNREAYRQRFLEIYDRVKKRLGFCPRLAANQKGIKPIDAAQQAGVLETVLDEASRP